VAVQIICLAATKLQRAATHRYTQATPPPQTNDNSDDNRLCLINVRASDLRALKHPAYNPRHCPCSNDPEAGRRGSQSLGDFENAFPNDIHPPQPYSIPWNAQAQYVLSFSNPPHFHGVHFNSVSWTCVTFQHVQHTPLSFSQSEKPSSEAIFFGRTV
jgi:hypothetical protein